MGKLNPFKSKKPDTSAIEAQEKRLAEQEKKIAAEEKARKEAEARKKKADMQARQGQRGGRSLLSGLEIGVGDQEDTRGTLG